MCIWIVSRVEQRTKEIFNQILEALNKVFGPVKVAINKKQNYLNWLQIQHAYQ